MLTRTGPVYGPNAFSDLKDDGGRSEERPRAGDRLTATALRRELANLLKAAADKADEWRKAAQDEWAPLAPDYHAGNGEVTPAIEGPYIEHRLAMGVGNDIRRMFDQLDPDIPSVRTDSPRPPLSQEEADGIARAGIEAYQDAEANCGRIIALTEEDLSAAAIAGQNALEAREPDGWSVRAAVVDREWRQATFVVKRLRPGDAP